MRVGSAALAAAIIAVVVPACSRGKAPIRFNPVPTAPATAPSSPEPIPTAGSSTVTITGEVVLETTQDFSCSYAIDDFFVRGRMGAFKGVPMYMSINVEFYKRPGTYTKRTQLLVRRISERGDFYASWYEGMATATILPNSGGVDLVPVTVPPEPGTQSTRPIRVGGHFACSAPASPGPG